MPVWIQIDAFDPVAGAAVALRAGSMDEPSVCMAAGGPWWPMIAKAPVLRYDLFDGAFGGEISAPTTAFSLQVEAWPNFGRYALADARVQVWTDITAAPIFDGRATAQPKLANGQAEISIKVDDSWLDKALLSTYAGTTGLEGPAALKGQAKPLALGAPRYVAGKLIDSVNNVFQVSAYGAIQAFEAALERLARFGAPIGDYSTFAALVGATIPAGAWATCKAQGLARFGAPTTGQVSFLIQGDVAGPNGWARKPGHLIRRLALLAGGAGKIHDASLNALDAARPYNLSLYLDQQTTARQLIQSIAASVNAVAGVSWTGKLFVVPVGLGTATMTLSADGTDLPPVRSVEQMEVAAPFAKIAVEAERAWTVHQLADIAFIDPLVDMGAYDAASYYRPGNIVQYAGASWRYKSSATPGSGNAPPAPPTTSNSWWTVLAQQGAAGANGLDAFGASLTPSAITVPCSAGGAPKGALPGAQIKAFRGAADITSTATYTVTGVSNLSGVSVSSGGLVTVSGISGGTTVLTGYVDVTVSNGVESLPLRLTYSKSFDGAAYVDGNIGVGAPSGSTFETTASLDLLMGPNGTIQVDSSGGFSAFGAFVNLEGGIDYSVNGGSTWTTAVTLDVNSASGAGEYGNWSGAASISGSTIGLTTRQTVKFRVQMRRTSAIGFADFFGTLYANWRG